MTPRPDFYAVAERLILTGSVDLPIPQAPRRHVWKISRIVTRRGYALPVAYWPGDTRGVVRIDMQGPDAASPNVHLSVDSNR